MPGNFPPNSLKTNKSGTRKVTHICVPENPASAVLPNGSPHF
jgi:hypothetical protein